MTSDLRPGGCAMRTVSLRRRVTLTTAAVLAVVLILVSLVVHSLFAVAVNRSQNAVLADRVQLAQQLSKQDTSPTELLARIDARSVRARLVLADGRTFGSSSTQREDQSSVKTRHVVLTGQGELDHARLTLQLDTKLLAGAQSKLVEVLAGTTAAALLVIVVGLPFGIRRALAPLDTMTLLARQIARGRRGQRLSPDQTDTELGRTATAFDEMLDALEGAEARANASEEQIRAFVADAAHELRTPISGIRAIAQAVVQQPLDADPETRQQLQLLLVREAQRAGRLVDDLVELARIDAGLQLRPTPTDLYDLTCAQLDRMRLLRPDIEFELAGDHVIAAVDSDRINQVLLNLLENACQAIRGNGAVTVLIRSTDALVELIVRDTGPGVPPGERERIFDRLVRLDQAREHRADGSGLGLAVARGIAEAHGGGLICVDPPTGAQGAVFVLGLKIA
ncbi:HAMP domain-containing sensor histidine kinase [Nocardia sp. NPDC046473]|uniref:sensor histidine kinase n=1 Tax=Nocardia sp. NPDC046473 TaxID=3155733 RepID=UPI0033CF075D